MSQVLVWKSDADGKLFEDKVKYQKHLRKLAAARREQRKVDKWANMRKEFLNSMMQVSSIDELNRFIKDNWEWFFTNGLSREFRYGKKSVKPHEYVNVSLSNMKFGNWSNSHSCPINGGDTNWGNYKDQVPTAYPGWRGRIDIKVRTGSYTHKGSTHANEGFGSSYFSNTGICTGAGGCGGGVGNDTRIYSYDVVIWAADFLVMWEKECRNSWISLENRNRERQWHALGGRSDTVPQVTAIPDDWVVPDPLVTV
jgi:hypothetical protein